MLKTYSSQDGRGIRILSIKRLVNEGVRDKLWAENPHVKPFQYSSAFLGLNLLLLLISAGTWSTCSHWVSFLPPAWQMLCISLIVTRASIAIVQQIEKANLSFTEGKYLSVPEVDGTYTESMGTSLIRVFPAKILRIAKEKKAQMGSTGSN